MSYVRRSGWALVALLLVTAPVGAWRGSGVKQALAGIDRALDGATEFVAEIEYHETAAGQVIDGSGTLHVRLDGRVRAEIGGRSPRTVLYAPPYLYTHRHDADVVERSDVTTNPGLLAQYLVYGFNPAGRGLRDTFEVELVGTVPLDESPSLLFTLTPKPKDAALTAAVAWIRLWVDPESGVPLQHEIVQAEGGAQLVVRHVAVEVNRGEPTGTYVGNWPEGTSVVPR